MFSYIRMIKAVNRSTNQRVNEKRVWPLAPLSKRELSCSSIPRQKSPCQLSVARKFSLCLIASCILGFPNNFTTCSTRNPKSCENCYYICGKALKLTKIFSEENAEKHKALLLVFTQSIYCKTMHNLWLRRNVFCKSTSNYSMNSLHTTAPLFKEILTLHQTSLTHQVHTIPKNTTPILKLALMNSRNHHFLTQAQSGVYLFESLQTTRV